MSTKLRIIGGGIVFIGILAGVVSRSLLAEDMRNSCPYCGGREFL